MKLDKKYMGLRDSPGGPVAKTLLPVQGALPQSTVRELDPTCSN